MRSTDWAIYLGLLLIFIILGICGTKAVEKFDNTWGLSALIGCTFAAPLLILYGLYYTYRGSS